MYVREKPVLKLKIRQQGEDLVCYLPADRQILFPYGETSCEIGRLLKSDFETCRTVARIMKGDKDPTEMDLDWSIKEKERPCLALARLLNGLSKVADAVKVYEDCIVLCKSAASHYIEDMKALVCESVGEYYSQRDSGGKVVRNMYKVTT